MIKILVCAHELSYGGTQLGLYNVLKHMDKSKFQFIILAMKPGGLSGKFEKEFEVHYDDMDYPNITSYIKKLQPDLMHAVTGGGRDLPYITEAAKHIPVTQIINCPRQVSNKKDVVASIVASNYVYNLQQDTTNITKIDYAFDTNEYQIQYGKEHFKLPKDKLVIGSLGNLRRENKDFLKIAKRFRKNKNVTFIIKTNLRPRKKFRYSLRYKRGNLILLNEFITEDEKMSLFNCFDIFLYPTSNEAYGIVFLEAMSQKKPIISYHDSAMPETIGNGGLLAPVNDVDKMCELLQHLIDNPNERNNLGEHGHKLIHERNNPIDIAKKHEAFFMNALNPKKPINSHNSDTTA